MNMINSSLAALLLGFASLALAEGGLAQIADLQAEISAAEAAIAARSNQRAAADAFFKLKE